MLYSAHGGDDARSTPASRREAARLREARNPAEAYGSRVYRRLRARWFSIVPVRRRTAILSASLIVGATLLLCFGHYASVAWPSIAYRPDIARPLRLDRPDSFGRWLHCALLVGASGASFLIYQLRRYRLDDFRGHYRLWRLVLVVLMLASVNALVSLVDWAGAILDAMIGRRVALTGRDWLHMFVCFGGVILAIRLLAEVRRCHFALLTMTGACLALVAQEAARWNVLKVESLGTWSAVTSAPLVAFTLLFLSFGAYLRMLYREVRRIDTRESLRTRLTQMRLRVFQRSERGEDDRDDPPEEEDSRRRRRWWSRSRSSREETNSRDDEQDSEIKEEAFDRDDSDDGADVDNEAHGEQGAVQPRSRGWFGRRRTKPADNGKNPKISPDTDDQASAVPQPKRRRFGLRLKPQTSAAQQDNDAQEETQTRTKPAQNRSRGLGGFRRQQATKESPAAKSHAAVSANADEDLQDEEDLSNIDWSSLSKSERRRLRKQLKRQNKAA